jgi:hypothetical protein
VALLSGCGKHSAFPGGDEGILSDSYIFFDADVVSTKGTLISGITLPSEVEKSRFGVFGYREDGSQIFNMYHGSPATGQLASAFNNVAVMYRQDAGGAFYYDALTLWTKGRHSFFAYFPYTDSPSEVLPAISVASSATSRPSLSYVQPTQLDKMTDVLTAATLNKLSTDSDSQPVQLKFEHRLFAFDVILKNLQSASARGLRVKRASVEFTDVISGATLYFEDGADEDLYADLSLGAATHTPFTHTFLTAEAPTLEIPAPAADQKAVEHNFNATSSFLFLPCPSLKVKFTMTFLNAWNEECVFDTDVVTIAPEGGLLPGHKYDLVIRMQDNGMDLTFTPEIKEWESFEDIQIKFE